MAGKKQARIAYYRGVKDALTEHMTTTESGLRALPGLDEKELEKIVASVRKRHEKLLKEVDLQLAGDDAA